MKRGGDGEGEGGRVERVEIIVLHTKPFFPLPLSPKIIKCREKSSYGCFATLFPKCLFISLISCSYGFWRERAPLTHMKIDL